MSLYIVTLVFFHLACDLLVFWLEYCYVVNIFKNEETKRLVKHRFNPFLYKRDNMNRLIKKINPAFQLIFIETLVEHWNE